VCATYHIIQVSNGVYELHENKTILGESIRTTLRQDLDAIGRSSKFGWLKIPVFSIMGTLSLQYIMGSRGIADYLRSKGFSVVKPLNVSDGDLVKYYEEVIWQM